MLYPPRLQYYSLCRACNCNHILPNLFSEINCIFSFKLHIISINELVLQNSEYLKSNCIRKYKIDENEMVRVVDISQLITVNKLKKSLQLINKLYIISKCIEVYEESFASFKRRFLIAINLDHFADQN